MGVSKDTGSSDLLMTILVRKVRVVDTTSDWIIRRLVNQEGFYQTWGKLILPCEPIASNKCKGNLQQKILVCS